MARIRRSWRSRLLFYTTLALCSDSSGSCRFLSLGSDAAFISSRSSQLPQQHSGTSFKTSRFQFRRQCPGAFVSVKKSVENAPARTRRPITLATQMNAVVTRQGEETNSQCDEYDSEEGGAEEDILNRKKQGIRDEFDQEDIPNREELFFLTLNNTEENNESMLAAVPPVAEGEKYVEANGITSSASNVNGAKTPVANGAKPSAQQQRDDTEQRDDNLLLNFGEIYELYDINKDGTLDRSERDQLMRDITALDISRKANATDNGGGDTQQLRRRNAQSVEEGILVEEDIRRGRTKPTVPKLLSLLDKAGVTIGNKQKGRKYAARTVRGLINALAEEIEDLTVEIDACDDTPMWSKEVSAISINFTRLGFRPLRMGGHEELCINDDKVSNRTLSFPNLAAYFNGRKAASVEEQRKLIAMSDPDEAFERFDVDNSGALDPGEIAKALNLAAIVGAGSSRVVDDVDIICLASDLIQLYDVNGDGVVDRSEYQNMIEDMATLREAQRQRQDSRESSKSESLKQLQETGKDNNGKGLFSSVKSKIRGLLGWQSDSQQEQDIEGIVEVVDNEDIEKVGLVHSDDIGDSNSVDRPSINVTEDPKLLDSMAKPLGSIVISDLKIDMRRLMFGAIPVVKRITPGGPLILEPFTVTTRGSFNSDDIIDSSWLTAGLKQLVRTVIRRRVGSFRDFSDQAVFYGRQWKLRSESAPFIDPEITKVEFDKNNRLVVTGRARIRTNPGAPIIEQGFKVRTKIGTRKGGRFIRVVEPELALVVECPKWAETILGKAYQLLGMELPPRPEPIYSFFPIYSPVKVSENDGFDMGEDNRIKSIYVQNNALRFELSAVLRPGRFLGNHYIAFTVPDRTFIITLARIKAGMREARKNKKAAQVLEKAEARLRQLSQDQMEKQQDLNKPESTQVLPQPPSFFSRFVSGYLEAYEEPKPNERVAAAIRDWFGRQGSGEIEFAEETLANITGKTFLTED